MAQPLFAPPPERVGVLALQGDFREHIELLGALGVDAFEVRGPAELARAHALVLPGGESTTMSVLLESSGLLEPLAERLAAGMPAFGTCAGMILLAKEVIDGRADQHHFGVIDISVRRNAFGRQRDSFEADLDVDGLDAPLHAVFIRAPVVERAGPEVEVLAAVNMDGPAGDGPGLGHRPVVCRQGTVLVTSFHPELAADPRLHELFLETLRNSDGTSTGKNRGMTRNRTTQNRTTQNRTARKENVRAL